MKIINEILGIYFYRKQFNDLVQKLRDKGCLNEENLEKVIRCRRKYIIFSRVYMVMIVIPALMILCYFSYFVLFASEKIAAFGVAETIVHYFCCIFVIISYPWLLIDSVKREWKCAYLVTLGKRSMGRVIAFEYDWNCVRKTCRYDFYDKTGYSYISYRLQAIKFDDTFDYQKGDRVNIAYDRQNPRNSIVISSKMEMFDLRKRELPAATNCGEALDE